MGLKIVWRDGWAHASGTIRGIGRIRESLGTRDPEQAEELRAALEQRLHRERVFGRAAVVTFEEAVEKYAQHLRDQGKEPRFLGPILHHLRGRALASITQGDLKDMARTLYPDASLATRRRQAITPSAAVINFAAAEYEWCAPIRVTYRTGPKPKRKAIGYDWIDAVRGKAGPHLGALVLFLFQSGMRIGEAVALTPKDRAGNTVTAGRTKNGEPRLVVLTPELAAELDALPPREGRLFGYASTAGVRQGLRRACKAADVEYLGTHQPGRHSFSSFLGERGWHPKKQADAGGWKTVRIAADDYTHFEEASAAAARAFSRGTNLPRQESGPPADDGSDDREANETATE